MLKRIYLVCVFALLWFAALGQTCPILIVDMKNDGFVNAIVEDPDLMKAHKNLGDHPNRIKPDILRSRKAFDDIQSYDKIERPNGYHKNNPFTGSEMFDPETGGYVILHPRHNVHTVGDAQTVAGSKAEFVMAEAFSRKGKRVTLLEEVGKQGGEPDAFIEGIGIFDFKNVDITASNLISNVQSKITASSRQGESIAFNLGDNPNVLPSHVNQAIANAIGTPDVKLPEWIGVVYKDGRAELFTIEQLRNGAAF